MSVQRTFSLIKPLAVKEGKSAKINAMIEENGLKIIAQKMIHLTAPQARKFYHLHSARSFFEDMVTSMTSSPVIAQVLEGENAVLRYRDLMGATNPSDAAEGTLRKAFATSISDNAVHGSDSIENAQTEIAQFFAGNEIVG